MNQVVVVAAVVSFASIAHAQPSDDGAPSVSIPRRFYVASDVGLGMPVGQVGIEGAYVVHPNFEIAAGFGLANIINLGDTGKPNPQLAIMPRFRLPLGPVRVTLGAGLSGGKYVVGSSPFADGPYDAKTTALWLNGEVGVDYVFPNGMFAGMFGGVGRVVAHTAVTDPHDSPLMTLPDSTLPSLGLRFGYAF